MCPKYSREERLYGLAEYCKRKNLTPDSPLYAKTIIDVCAANFGLSKESAEEHAATLRIAWIKDRWEAITRPVDEPQETESSSGSSEVDAKPPTLDALKNLYRQKSEPPKTIPAKAVCESEDSPKTVVQELIKIAKANDFNGVGKLKLGEARTYLKDDSLQMKDLVELFTQYAPEVEVERRPDNQLYLRFPKVKRRVIHVIPELRDPLEN